MTDDQIIEIATRYATFRDTLEPQIRGRHDIVNFVRECFAEKAAQMLAQIEQETKR